MLLFCWLTQVARHTIKGEIPNEDAETEMEAEAVNEMALESVLELSLKFTEFELRSFLVKLGEWKSITITKGGWQEDARAVMFYRLLSKLGLKMRSIFVPCALLFWDDMTDGIKDFTALAKSMHAGSSRKRKLGSTDSDSTKKKKKKKTKKGKKDRSEDDDTDTESETGYGDSGREPTVEPHAMQEKVIKVTSILECIRNSCVFGSQEAMDEDRYNSTMPEVVSTLPLRHMFLSDEEYLKFVEETCSPTLAALATSVARDLLWKPLNMQILQTMRG